MSVSLALRRIRQGRKSNYGFAFRTENRGTISAGSTGLKRGSLLKKRSQEPGYYESVGSPSKHAKKIFVTNNGCILTGWKRDKPVGTHLTVGEPGRTLLLYSLLKKREQRERKLCAGSQPSSPTPKKIKLSICSLQECTSMKCTHLDCPVADKNRLAGEAKALLYMLSGRTCLVYRAIRLQASVDQASKRHACVFEVSGAGRNHTHINQLWPQNTKYKIQNMCMRNKGQLTCL